ncbi:MAG: hypothetical protein Greene041662_949 [Candidatus Peregrinibacteria bacterium Greene0416_62]|nr:MAG: hypothetical protein Greene041662_949 [Candidatus Peregrinibacteria bacterium Greene0416_62]
MRKVNLIFSDSLAENSGHEQNVVMSTFDRMMYLNLIVSRLRPQDKANVIKKPRRESVEEESETAAKEIWHAKHLHDCLVAVGCAYSYRTVNRWVQVLVRRLYATRL